VRIGPADILLFLQALPLARRAQQVKSEPLKHVVVGMAGRRGVAAPHSVDRVAQAAARATSRWSRWFGGLDSCLTRSLVLGAMLGDRGNVELNIGFRSHVTDDVVAGHAWISVDGRPVGPDSELADDSYSRVLEVPFSGPEDSKRSSM
jgi:hypothetical protein